MSVRALRFEVDATGTCDGVTAFTLPPLVPPNVDQQVVIPVNAASGPLGLLNQTDPVFRGLVGEGGYLIRSLLVDVQNAALTRLLVGTQQRQPTRTVGGDTEFQTDPLFVSGPAGPTGAPQNLRGTYVPGGWSIAFFGDDGAGVLVPGPFTIVVELEWLATPALAHAIGGMNFSGAPVLLPA